VSLEKIKFKLTS